MYLHNTYSVVKKGNPWLWIVQPRKVVEKYENTNRHVFMLCYHEPNSWVTDRGSFRETAPLANRAISSGHTEYFQKHDEDLQLSN